MFFIDICLYFVFYENKNLFCLLVFIVYGYGKNLVVVYGHVKIFYYGKILVGH